MRTIDVRSVVPSGMSFRECTPNEDTMQTGGDTPLFDRFSLELVIIRAQRVKTKHVYIWAAEPPHMYI